MTTYLDIKYLTALAFFLISRLVGFWLLLLSLAQSYGLGNSMELAFIKREHLLIGVEYLLLLAYMPFVIVLIRSSQHYTLQ